MPPKPPRALTPYEADRLSKAPKVFGQTPSFLGVRAVKPASGLDGEDVVFMGVPWEGVETWGSYTGCELATKSIRNAAIRYGDYLPEFDLALSDHLAMADAGDVAVIPGDAPATMAAVRSAAGSIFSAGAAPVFFGGDHSYTPAVIEALAAARPGRIGIIHLDAHLDNLPEFGGDPLARCGPLCRLASQEAVRNQSVVSLGIRGPRNAPLQMALAREAGCHVVTMRQIRQEGLGACLDQALSLAHEGTDQVYLTICSDILDALCNPGGPADFDGLLPHQLFEAVRKVAAAGLAGMDFVEVYPMQDPAGRSSHLAAWTIIHALAGMAQARARA